MDYFGWLPEGCILEILSLTSPQDAARCSAISRGFKSAAESNVVWEKFLPSDYRDIISKSNSQSLLAYPSKKDIYLSLCDSPVLLDGDKGKLSFSLDKETGKQCLMTPARELSLICLNEPYYWQWWSDENSRFGEVAALSLFMIFYLHGKIETRLLSIKTKYVAYLVFKLTEKLSFIHSNRARVRFVDRESDIEAVQRSSVLVPRREGLDEKERYMRRADGWIEIELGRFFNDAGEDGHVQAKFMDIRNLVVIGNGVLFQGIEFRPEEEFSY